MRPSQPFLEKEGPKDIVRHKLVTKIVEAYEKYEVATSDELQATSDELQATSDELQATSDELQATSKIDNNE